MYVCEKCHERDKKVTQCKLSFKDHQVHMEATCFVCGKHPIRTTWCYNYKRLVKSNGESKNGKDK